MKTYMAKSAEVERKWYVIDASDKVLGRLATQVASILRGKHKPQFTPHVDVGDFVVIINADKVRLTGNKLQQKHMYRHSGFPGGIKSMDYKTLMEKNPEQAVRKAVEGMLPHNRLGDSLAKKLKIYRGSEHPHQAQQPEVWEA
ncbi:MAG: 50S ribosomal protein L13 [Firmicutes bacterium]|nr:50S ribosomal protein L13 [Bacillota bacterium]